MSPTAIAAGIVLAIGFGGGGWFVYRWGEAKLLKAEIAAEAAKRDAVQAALRAKVLSEALTESENVSRKRNAALLQSQKDLTLFQSAFEALYAQSKAAKDWSSTDVPNDVRCVRRKLNPTLPGDNVPCPVSPTGPNAGTGLKRPDERPFIDGKSIGTGRFTTM